MRDVLFHGLGVLFFLGVLAQPSEAPQPGFAGHSDCRAHFAVMWLDGVPTGQIYQSTHYGLSDEQLRWWREEGYKKAPSFCYLSQLRDVGGKLEVDCPGCSSDWKTSFRWLVFEHVDEKQHRVRTSSRTVTGPTGSRPTEVISGIDPSTRTERDVEVVATRIGVYALAAPIRPPTGQDQPAFFYSAEEEKSSRADTSETARNDRQAFQAGVDFLRKRKR